MIDSAIYLNSITLYCRKSARRNRDFVQRILSPKGEDTQTGPFYLDSKRTIIDKEGIDVRFKRRATLWES